MSALGVSARTDAAEEDDSTVASEGSDTAEVNEVAEVAKVAEDAQDTEDTEDTEESDVDSGAERSQRARRLSWRAVLCFGVIPVVALLLSAAAGYLHFQDSSARGADVAAAQAVRAASDSAVAMLSYNPDNASATLGAARDRLTGTFRDSYTSLINQVVIPGAKQKNISVTARVAAAASVSASVKHAVVLLFIDQTMIVGSEAPTDTASTVEVSLDEVGDRWLISGFDPK
jgi:Mce-associated membrane protein